MTYFNKRYHLPGTAPGTLVDAESIAELKITLVDYTAKAYLEEEIATPAECQRLLESDSTT